MEDDECHKCGIRNDPCQKFTGYDITHPKCPAEFSERAKTTETQSHVVPEDKIVVN